MKLQVLIYQKTLNFFIWIVDDNRIEILDVSATQLNHYVPKTIVYSEYPLKCKMASLKALYLKRDWRLKGINDTFPVCIARNTQIIYK